MAVATPCPDPRQLEQLLLGRLAEDTVASLEKHVEECPRCRVLLPTLPAEDALVVAVRASRRPPLKPSDQNTLRDLMPRLHDLPATLPSPVAGHVPLPPLNGTTEQEPAPPSVPGYEILGVLGRGGMGVVYKARQVQLQRLVALKMILVGANAGPEQRLRFLNEARAVARLQHPNIIQIHEIGEHDGLPYFSLELVEGGSLAQQLTGTPEPPRQCAELCETLARAMHYSHQRGIVHRDLKPANVLLSPRVRVEGLKSEEKKPGTDLRSAEFQLAPFDCAAWTLKVTDFGLAKQDTDSGQTKSGAILGTPSYMAPEQATGRLKEVGPATDIYALGAILYEMLTGRPPFKGETPFDTMMLVASEEPVSPRRLQPKVPRDLESICLRCLRREPGKRYASAAELADELHRYLNGEPLAYTRPVGAIERAWRWCLRHPSTAIAYGLACAVMVSLVVLGVASLFAVRESQNAAEQKRLAIQLGHEQKETKEALQRVAQEKARAEGEKTRAEEGEARAETEKIRAEREKARADELATLITLDHGLTVCEHGDLGRGMLWLARGLKKTPTAADDLQRLFRANLAACRADLHPLKLYWEQKKPIMAVAISPDGRTIATGNQKMIAQLWDAATGQSIGPEFKHEGWVHSVAFSRDGRTLLTASGDNMARLWDVSTGKLLRELKHEERTVWSAVFSPDERQVLTGSGQRDVEQKGAVQLWDVAAGKPIWRHAHEKTVLSVAFSPDGRTVLIGGADKTIRLYDSGSGAPRSAPLQRPGWVQAVAFSPDGKYFAAGTGDSLYTHTQEVSLWQVHPPQQLRSLSHQGNVNAVAFSPDGKTVLTGSADQTAQLWDFDTALPRGGPLKHQGWVQAVAFSPDGNSVLTGSADSGARVWQLTPRSSQVLVHDRGQGVWAVAFSRDGRTLLTGTANGTVRLWNTATREPAGKLLHHDDGILAAVFSPDGRTILTGSRDKRAALWDSARGKLRLPPLVHPGKGEITAVAFSPDGEKFLTASSSKSTQLWATATGKPIGMPLPQITYVTSAAFSPDGKKVVTAGWGKIQFWDAASGEPVGQPFAEQGWIQAVAFSPDGLTLATGSFDSTVRLWKVSTGQPIGPPMLHQGCVNAVAFSPDGKLLLTGSADRTARLWDVKTGKPIGLPLSHQGGVRSVAFSPDGRQVLTGSEDQTARLWVLPVPVSGNAERLLCWVEVLTGMTLGEDGIVRGLDAASLNGHREKLKRLGGPPG